ncbi:unnamed protein product [Effrenium voratum]|uniref:RRM domain-containing protein n=1 Tax=Effrenium voratum TaxID=2562239 RepID=A0AA36MTR0_9DINO|nr:unnamed protein product [Effrenium voratum]
MAGYINQMVHFKGDLATTPSKTHKMDEGSTDGSEGTYGSRPTTDGEEYQDATREALTEPWTVPFPRWQDTKLPMAECQDWSAAFPMDAGLNDEMAKLWLQREVAELAEMMGSNEMPRPVLAGPQAIDAQIRSLHSQLNRVSQLLRSPQSPMSPMSPSMSPMSPSMSPMSPSMSPTMSPLMSPKKSAEEDVFTVMMRNIPNKYTQRMLIEEVNSSGFNGAYDFLYLPIDKESGANKGYAFLNFVRPDLAYAFKMAFDGKQMAQFRSNKIVNVAPATIQGFEANYEHFSKTRVNYGDPDVRPLFLKKPKAVKTRSLRKPPGLEAVQAEMNLPGVNQRVEGGCFCPFCGARRGPSFMFCQSCGRHAQVAKTGDVKCPRLLGVFLANHGT